MKLRAARQTDKRAIGALVALYPKELSQTDIPSTKDFFVVEDKGNIVGCCALEIYSKKIAEVRSLAVATGAQGKGVATLLVKACLKRAKQRKVRQVLAITGAVGFFQEARL